MSIDETTYKHLYEESLVKIAESYYEGYCDGYGDRNADEISQQPTFTKWDDMVNHIFVETGGCKPFASEGINYRKKHKACILRSVDDTTFYDDDLSDINRVDYTLAGQSGDQCVDSSGNRQLLNPDLKHIYLYRVKKDGKKKTWIWYGEYTIIDKATKQHIGKDSFARKIIKISLVRKIRS